MKDYVRPKTTLESDEGSATYPAMRLSEDTSAPVDQVVQVSPWVHFVAGGIGGMTGAVFTCPLDVVKTRLQADFYSTQLAEMRKAHGSPKGAVRNAWLHFSETGAILKNIYRQEGYRALFKGLGPNLVGVIPSRSINFFTYGVGKEFIAKEFNDGKEASWVHLVAAANAGIVTSTFTNPIWLIKTRLQLDKASPDTHMRQYKNSWDCLRQVMRTEGIRGLYKGLTASYLGASESTLQWVLYEKMKQLIRHKEQQRLLHGYQRTSLDSFLDWSAQSGAAGAAKLMASLVTYPHEVVRTRLRQAPSETGGRLKYNGLVQCFKLVVKEEGFLALYGGLTPHLLRTVPNSIIMFGTFELVVKMLSS